jgi:hypothetical protein
MNNTSGSTNSNPQSNAGTTPTVGRAAGANHGLRGALNAMLSGVQTVIPDGNLIRVDGVDQKKADVVTELQAVMTQYAAVDSSAAAAKADRAQLRQALPAAHLLLQHLKDAMIAYLGRGSPELQKFGLKARSGRKPTVQQKALAAEKARRTRALRGTKGSRQKAAIRFAGEPTLVLGPNSPQPSSASGVASGSKPPAAGGGQ